MTTSIDAMVGKAERRCRSAFAHDWKKWWGSVRRSRPPYEQTAFARLVRTTEGPDRAAVSLWVHAEQVRGHRRYYGWDGVLTWAVRHLQEVGTDWSAEIIGAVLDRSRAVAESRPVGSADLLALPFAATAALPESERARLVPAWRRFHDCDEMLGGSLFFDTLSGKLAREIERLLPAPPGSPDVHRLFTDGCPLAGRLRTVLGAALTEPAVAMLLRLCESWPEGHAAHASWASDVKALLDDSTVRVLRRIVETALAHRPVDTPVCVRGTWVRRRVWCLPQTWRLLSRVMVALAMMPGADVDRLLGAVGRNAVLAYPVAEGRRAPLATEAVRALAMRRTRAATEELRRIFDEPCNARELDPEPGRASALWHWWVSLRRRLDRGMPDGE